ncbi:MAG: SDR family NAD(P)-dependent oxidoreductase [Euryarchaeota archaeon]
MGVLVTGAAGFIGSHVVHLLLEKGYKVRATARNPKNASFLEAFPKHKGATLEILQMDLFNTEEVDAAVKGCEVVIHCAAALMVGVRDAQLDVVDPSVLGTENLCSALQKAGCVQAIVHTSSVAAIRRTHSKNGQIFTSSDWCDDASVTSNPYGMAKAKAERVMRNYVEQFTDGQRPRLVTIHPSIVFGPVFQKRHTQGSMAYLKHFTGRLPFVLHTHLNFVDVRDVAEAHVAAIEGGKDGSRYILHKEGMWMRDIGRSLRQFAPGKKWATLCLPSPLATAMAAFHPKLTVRQVRSSLGRHVSYDVESMEEELGILLHSTEKTLVDSVESLLALSRKV